jgi:hypothetical protein
MSPKDPGTANPNETFICEQWLLRRRGFGTLLMFEILLMDIQIVISMAV